MVERREAVLEPPTREKRLTRNQLLQLAVEDTLRGKELRESLPPGTRARLSADLPSDLADLEGAHLGGPVVAAAERGVGPKKLVQNPDLSDQPGSQGYHNKPIQDYAGNSEELKTTNLRTEEASESLKASGTADIAGSAAELRSSAINAGVDQFTAAQSLELSASALAADGGDLVGQESLPAALKHALNPLLTDDLYRLKSVDASGNVFDAEADVEGMKRLIDGASETVKKVTDNLDSLRLPADRQNELLKTVMDRMVAVKGDDPDITAEDVIGAAAEAANAKNAQRPGETGDGPQKAKDMLAAASNALEGRKGDADTNLFLNALMASPKRRRNRGDFLTQLEDMLYDKDGLETAGVK